MKKIYFIISLLAISCFVSQAQLKVLSDGRIQVGLVKADQDLLNVTTMQILGKYGDYRAGSKLTFGDFGRYTNQGWNVFVGEYGTTDTDLLWLHGKNGMYFTTNGYASDIIAYYIPSANSNFIFNTDIKVNGVTITSDVRLKENVKSLENPLDILNQLNGVSYTYNLSEIKEINKQNQSKFVESTENNVKQTDLESSASYMVDSEKELRNKQIREEVEKIEAENANRKRIGFLAQDIEKVLPELVQKDENGVMSIDYIGFIPIIIESIKEMQSTIDAQQLQIEALLSMLDNEKVAELRSATSMESITISDDTKLYDDSGASVSYRLPTNFSSANLQVFDITGKLLKTVKLDSGGNRMEINKNEIGLGTFIYVLLVDGQKRDTLKKYVR